ncbi:MAG: A/G-specific adenine glycosylase, partial [Gemmatimonadota bacterium]
MRGPGPEAGAAPVSSAGGGPAAHAGATLGSLAASLLAWFDGRERDVPWRGETDPYRIWVAEVMAQQTRIETVREYYGRFVDRFPDVATLAAADPDDVMKAWEGLGYYARARNLQRSAREVVERFEGRLPAAPERLRELPGIGAYTAGAIASLAFGRAEPAIDGNARRVLSRLFDLEAPTPRRLEEAARALLDACPGRPGALNQTLMDLGGGPCAPASPACAACPVRAGCLALARGTVEE